MKWWKGPKHYSIFFRGLFRPRIQFNFWSKKFQVCFMWREDILFILKPIKCSKRTGEIPFFPCSCLLCYPGPRGMLRPKSKQTYPRQVSFSLLTSCQEPPEEIPTPPEKSTDTHLVEREGTAEWQSTAKLPTPVQMEIRPGMMAPGTLVLRRAIGLAVIEKCPFSRGGSARGQQWIFQEQPSRPVCLAVRATCLRTGAQRVIILGLFPFRSTTLGESLTSDYALLREYKTLAQAKFCAFLTLEPCSHFFSVPMSLFWAEFLVTWAKIPRKRPLCTDRRANSFNHNHKPLP